jgi:hypothetical protein
MKLMALNADECNQRGRVSRWLKQIEIFEICVNILIHCTGFNGMLIDLSRDHATHVGHGAVGHEAPVKSLDGPINHVLTRFDDYDS